MLCCLPADGLFPPSLENHAEGVTNFRAKRSSPVFGRGPKFNFHGYMLYAEIPPPETKKAFLEPEGDEETGARVFQPVASPKVFSSRKENNGARVFLPVAALCLQRTQ